MRAVVVVLDGNRNAPVGVAVAVFAKVPVGGMRSQTGRAMIVPLLSRLLTRTVPVGVPDSWGVAAMDVSVETSVSLLELDG